MEAENAKSIFFNIVVAQSVKNLPAGWVRSLGWEYPLEEGMATHSSILVWRIPMDRGAWRAAVHGVTELDLTEQLNTHGRLPGEITITSDMQMTPPLWQKVKRN